MIDYMCVGKESLATQTNEQLAAKLYEQALVNSELQTEVYLDERYTGYVMEYRTSISGRNGRLMEYEQITRKDYVDGFEDATEDIYTLSVFSGEENPDSTYDLITTFGFKPGTDMLIVSQARHYLLDIEDETELARLQRYPIYGIMHKELIEQWHDLVVSLWADTSLPA